MKKIAGHPVYGRTGYRESGFQISRISLLISSFFFTEERVTYIKIKRVTMGKIIIQNVHVYLWLFLSFSRCAIISGGAFTAGLFRLTRIIIVASVFTGT